MPGEWPIEIPRALLETVYREARRAYPAECCGWLTGPRSGTAVDAVRPCTNAQSQGDHPTAPGRGAESAYVIAGDDLLALVRSLDSVAPAQVIYHSHPNGKAYFSETDRKIAASPWGDGPAYPCQQLVIGIDEQAVTEAALFAWSKPANDFVEIARYEGAPL